ncbi:MAG: RNA pseudouridine synthase [Pseudomonadota bacterium]
MVVGDDGRDALALLRAASGLPRRAVEHAMHSGAVWLHHRHGVRRLRRRSAQLAAGDELHLYYNAQVLGETPPAATLVHDGGRWSLWIKPAGMRAQGSKWGDHTTLGRWAETHLEPRRDALIVHRLDLATCGLMLLAHDRRAAAALSSQFAARSVVKRYRALVHGKFPSSWQGLALDSALDGKAASSHATRLNYCPDSKLSLVDVRTRTGRKHQVRRHLAQAGFPIVGDTLHGDARAAAAASPLRLAAVYLAFSAPGEEGERREFQWLPEDWPLSA